MKFKIAIAVFCLFANYSFSQNSMDIDQILLEKYSQNDLKNLKENNSELFSLYQKSFLNGVTILKYDDKQKEKGNTYPIKEIIINESEPFNYLKYGFDLLEDSQYFLVNNGSILVIIRGTRVLKNLK